MSTQATKEISDWLEKLGMSEYAQRFAENDIDTSVLPHLTEGNLKELGISLGHRVKLLAAIRELSGVPPTAEPTATPPISREMSPVWSEAAVQPAQSNV